jgi:thioredoxin reductase (NADPH)
MRGERVFVAGAGNAAGQAALHLADYAEHVTIIIRDDGLSESMSEYLVKQILLSKNITLLTNTIVVDGKGAHRLQALVLENLINGTRQEGPATAVFILIGAKPHTDWLPPEVACDKEGYIRTGNDLLIDGKLPDHWNQDRLPYVLETSLPGVFAAGDVRFRSVKRVATAVGEGSIVIQLVHQYLSDG